MQRPPSPLVNCLQATASHLRERQAMAFGELTPRLAKEMDLRPPINREAAEQWGRLVAEEILLAHVCGLEVHPSWLRALNECPPLAGGPETLGELAQAAAWVAVVPVAREGQGSGTLIRIWGLHGNGQADLEPMVQDAGVIFPGEQWRIRLGGWDKRITGRSWMLGAALAECAARDERPDVMLQFARNWIVTGEVADGGQVESVRIGNKAHIGCRHRRWLVPESCHGGFSGIAAHIHGCASLGAGWSHVSGDGVLADGVVEWPEPSAIHAMHATVSQAVRPVIAAALTARPRMLVLWHSDNAEMSGNYAKLLKDFFYDDRVRSWPGWHDRPPRVVTRPLPSGDLADAERVLREAGLDRVSEGTVIFNITGGTLLMRLAVHQIARNNPSLWLVYRPEGGTSHPSEMVTIRNAGHLPRTGSLRPSIPPDVDASYLQTTTRETDLDALVRGVFPQL